MADILLIQPPIRDFYLTRKRTIPYGLMSIAASLEKNGFDVALLDALATNKTKTIATPSEMAFLKPYYGRADRSPFALFHHYRHFGYAFQHIARLVRESTPFLVGIASLFTPYAEMAVQTAETVKKILPGCWVVLGGHHPSELPRHALANKAVDFIIRGEGENSLPLLAEALQKNKPLKGIPGLCFRKSDGSLHLSAQNIARNLDDHPLPAIDRMKTQYYCRGKRPGYAILASRGCPFNCSYCAMGRSPTGAYRQRSVTHVIAEMKKAIRTHNCCFFDFEDENLSHDRSWFASLLEGIIDSLGEGDLELRAMNGLFPPSLDRDLFNRPDVRRSFNRLVHAARDLDLACVGYIIVGAPFQDPMQSVKDLLYLWKSRVLAGVSVYYPAPGSADYERCALLNLLPQKTSLLRSSALPLDHVTSRLQTATLLRLGRIANFMKMLADKGASIPPAESCSQTRFCKSADRLAVGRTLLKWFFDDKGIRGVDADGRVYTHTVDRKMVELFIEELRGERRVRALMT